MVGCVQGWRHQVESHAGALLPVLVLDGLAVYPVAVVVDPGYSNQHVVGTHDKSMPAGVGVVELAGW